MAGFEKKINLRSAPGVAGAARRSRDHPPSHRGALRSASTNRWIPCGNPMGNPMGNRVEIR